MLVLSDPCRTLIARTTAEVPALLDEIGIEQARGRYVAGYIAYEAGSAFGLKVGEADSLPLAWMAVYKDTSVLRLSEARRCQLLESIDVPRLARAVAEIKPALSVSQNEFNDAIASIRDLIAAGDTYQVNYTVRANFDLDVDPFAYFMALLVRQPVPYAAFLDLGETQVLSLSPELFLRRHGRLVESMPMKGTRPRGTTPAADAALATELISSEKDRAENLMIVDMVRNDLGRVSRAGSVEVPTLFAVEPYRTIWQMTSAVSGYVRRDATPAEIMAATFPGASITGAPKHRTMEIIAQLETEPRGVYTGTVGLLLPGGDFTCNLAIRTLVHKQGSFRLGVGSGVVWDSVPEEEYEETLAKASFALPGPESPWEAAPLGERVRAASTALFETILLETETVGHPSESSSPSAASGPSAFSVPPQSSSAAERKALQQPAVLSRYRYLSEHLDRMAVSASVLGIVFDRAAAEKELAELALAQSESAVVRLQLEVDGRLCLTTRPTPEKPPRPVSLMVSPFRVEPNNPLLAHKTTARELYDREYSRAHAGGYYEALFLNTLSLVTEGAITNIFARFGTTWATPPVQDGLLPGIWRADFAGRQHAVERSLTLDELKSADEIVVGNSVRGMVAVGSLIVNYLEGLA